MFIGNSQKESSYFISSPLYRCRVWWLQNWLWFEQHYSDSVSSISSVKNSPANAIKISIVILNLASDKPDSDKISRFFLTVAYEHCVTIKQTVIWAGRRVKKNTTKKSDVHKHDSVFGHVRYINILTWLRGFRVENEFFKSFFCLSIPKRDLNTKKTPLNIEVCPESLWSMLEYWYIERGLLIFVLNGCSLVLSESYI